MMKHLPDTECALDKFGRGGTAAYCMRCHRTVSVRDPGRCEAGRERPAELRSDTQ